MKRRWLRLESLNSGKAPGGDGVYPEAAKALLTLEPEMLRVPSVMERSESGDS